MKDTKASLDCLFAYGQISLKSYMRRLGHLGEKGGIPMTDYEEVLTKVVKNITYWRDEIATAGSEFGSIYSSAMNHALEIIFYEIEQADTERKVRKE